MEIDEVGHRVAAAADAVSGAAARLALVGPGAAAFAGDGPGRLGELGRELHILWSGALAAREREAAGHGARLADLAAALHLAADRYRETDDAVHRRHREVR